MTESDLITHPAAEVLVRVPLLEGGYREGWVSVASIVALAVEAAGKNLSGAVDRLLAEDSEAPSEPPTV